MSLAVCMSLGDLGLAWTAGTEAYSRGLNGMSLTVYTSHGDCGMEWIVETEACRWGNPWYVPHCHVSMHFEEWDRDRGLQRVFNEIVMDIFPFSLQYHKTHGGPRFPLDSQWLYWTTLGSYSVICLSVTLMLVVPFLYTATINEHCNVMKLSQIFGHGTRNYF